jgi:hypothetical protein
VRLLLHLGKGKSDPSNILEGGHDRHSAKDAPGPPLTSRTSF